MKPAGQEDCIYNDGLFVTELPVWYQKNGKVNPWVYMQRGMQSDDKTS